MELYSRYGDTWKLEDLGDNKYVFKSPAATRVIFGDEAGTIIAAIDPPGGPMISIGDSISGKKLKEIIDMKLYFILTFDGGEISDNTGS